MSEINREGLAFTKLRPQILLANDLESSTAVQSSLFSYLSEIYTQLEKSQETISKEDLTFVSDQLDALISHFLESFSDTPDALHISVEVDKLIAKTYVFTLSLMMKTAHEKFNIKLIDITTKMNDLLVSDIKNISMKTNWYFATKHLAIILLQYIFTKFNGFLNSFKAPLLTALYKYMTKCHDNYNSSIENSIFKANYFTDMAMLVDIMLSNDTGSNTLDDKLFNRLVKLAKAITTRSTDGDYIYPLLSVAHSRNFLVSLLKSDRYISTITTKKSISNLQHYLTTISPFMNEIVSDMKTHNKKLRMSLSKNLSDLLVFNCIVYGANMNEDQKALEYSISYIMINYMKPSSNLEVKTGLLETLIQLTATLNLYYQTSSVSTKYINGVTFASLRVFDILNVVFHHIFGIGRLSVQLKTSSKDEQPATIKGDSSLVSATKILNHLEIFYQFLIREIDSDINELILLGKLVLKGTQQKGLKISSIGDLIQTSDQYVDNQWYILSLMKFSQLLIRNLDEYITTQLETTNDSHEDLASQLSFQFFQLCKHNEFKIRVTATETLILVLKVKPELSFQILNSALDTMTKSFDDAQADKKFMFNENHGYAFLIASILTYCPKSSIGTDFVLRLFSISGNLLKKFNSSVITTNLFGGGGSFISNINYEKQLIGWMVMMGLFNYATDETGVTNSNFFLMESSQFLNIWKNLLAHAMPSNFVQFENVDATGYLQIKNMADIMKLMEIKNHALVCLVSYITYLSSTKPAVSINGQDTSSLLTPDIAKQLNHIINKSFTFVINLRAQIESVSTVPSNLDLGIKVNKLRIYECFIKLVPFLNLKNDLNSTLLIEVVNNFSDMYMFSHKADEVIPVKSSKKKDAVPSKIDDNDVYQYGDGLNYGLTSKITQYKIDELMIKSNRFKSSGLKFDYKEYDIDMVPMHSILSVESSYIRSNTSPVTVFDTLLEALTFETIPHCFLNDYLMHLFNGTLDLGYTDNKKYPVNNLTMIVDVSIEIFAISFPYLTVKVQQSIIETMRSSIFYKTKDNKENASTFIGETLRKKAIMINSSVAIHSALTFMNNHNSNIRNAQSKLKLSKTIALVIIETVKSMDASDEYISLLNSESVGLVCSLVEDGREEMLANQVSIFIKSIVDNPEPNSRSFAVQVLAKTAQYSNLMNTQAIVNVLFALIVDPHPVVHSASMDALATFVASQSQVELNPGLINKILIAIQNAFLKDSFGINSPIIAASNMNYRSRLNSDLLLCKLLRTIINVAGPMITTWSPGHKLMVRNLLFAFMDNVTNDFDLLSRELVKIIEELEVFDRSFVPLRRCGNFIKFMLVNNFRVGIYKSSLKILPMADDDNDTTAEVYPCTTSDINWNLALNAFNQLLKLDTQAVPQLMDDAMMNLLWIALEYDPESIAVKTLFKGMIEVSVQQCRDDRFKWFKVLTELFTLPKLDLYQELLKVYKKRINNGGMFFNPTLLSKTPNPNTTAPRASVNLPRADTSKSVVADDDSTLQGDDDAALNGNESAVPSSKARDQDSESQENRIIGFSEEDLIQVTVLENEPTNWRFKLLVIELLIQFVSYTRNDEKLKLYLSKKIPELVRITFTCSTSNLVTLRVASLRLLSDIVDIFGEMRDPLDPEVSILDQQQAQIVTALIPAFSKDSNIDLAGEALVLASKLIGSKITHISKMGRVTKILTSALEELSSQSNISDIDQLDSKSKVLKIGDITILTKKAETKTKLYVLQAWALLKIHASKDDYELQELINTYIGILVPLWLHTLRDFAMTKYGGDFMISNADELDMSTYEPFWTEIFEVTGTLIEEDPNILNELLGDDATNFFFILFGQAIEYLIKSSSKSQYSFITERDMAVINSLEKTLNMNIAVEILFKDGVFVEFIDLLDRLVIVSESQVKSKIIDLSSTLFKGYFNAKRTAGKSSEEIHNDVDKLFELLRINLLAITKILPFVRDKEINLDKLVPINSVDLAMIKRSYDSILEMISFLPDVMKTDLYTCVLYSFSLIYELNNQEIIGVLLPTLKRVISSLDTIDGENQNLLLFYSTIKNYFDLSNNNSLLTIFIIITTLKSLTLDEQECDEISDYIINGLTSEQTNIVAISTQTLKTLIRSNKEGSNGLVLIKLVPKLINLLTSNSKQLEEPRLVLGVLITFSKSFTKEEDIINSYKLTLPVMLWFDESTEGKYTSYLHTKILELIQFSPFSFKKFIDTCCTREQSISIQELVKYTSRESSEDIETELNGQSHIQLKTFG